MLMLKRLFDLIFALVGLVLLSPLFIVLAIWIKRESPGPVFYRGVRAGKSFKPFRIFKFRSMVVNAEQLGSLSVPEDSLLVTKPGKFLRRFKLDELPQLINVLKGEMSLVGPRPEIMEYAKLYTSGEKNVYTIRPGMTDYASLWNIDEGAYLAGAKTIEETERKYLDELRPEKVRLQVKYVKEMSFWTDIKIILLTLQKIFSSKPVDRVKSERHNKTSK
ncbi:sugar transferase [Candidatus Uhrbacteria bacterium]|nr:sugar transferase [Candidatus Uhrbacteria bacterium]